MAGQTQELNKKMKANEKSQSSSFVLITRNIWQGAH